MAYSAHVRKKMIIENHSYGYFDYHQSELVDFLYKLKDEMSEEEWTYDPFVIEDEYGGSLREWEIDREWLEETVKYIEKMKSIDDTAFDQYTYGYVLDAFNIWLEKTSDKENFTYPEFVYISWF